MEKTKIILDVDTGVDDALAVLYALASPRLEVLGLTTCFGNVDVDTATRNTLALVALSGRDVPVYRGSEAPLLRPWSGPVPWIHGENGLGNAPVTASGRPAEEDAVHFIRRVVREHPHEVVLVPVARLTNVAKAFLFDPELPRLVRRVVVMGGAAFCPGNVTPVAEANIWGDPEAARIVFKSGAPVTMVGLDVTMRTLLVHEQLASMAARPYRALVQEAVRFYMHSYYAAGRVPSLSCPLHDPLAVGVAEDPALCTVRRYAVDVETQGELTAGMTVVDARADSAAEKNVDVCVDVDAPAFLQRFCAVLGMDASA
ncbi:ribosylpyrimidine nucleosidase [Alicyclobacillus cellulosilyticus]|uniref:Ribosylpyrimidine nucleosidase n=1 Tax=Alicyclobacillus cellulosilyticus TaxID=1003997 RepID=A0A917KBB3_9BACL|nr:nucleoside hydrolase [Alicyclobacillus cellulosilyticus]GGJ06743.1 ribosylpyrimidine nucleosidase [Alicyclobacillus cellulosilyticus]